MRSVEQRLHCVRAKHGNEFHTDLQHDTQNRNSHFEIRIPKSPIQMSDVLTITDLHVSIGNKPILVGVNLDLNSLLEGLMRIQDKINGHKIAKRSTGEGLAGIGRPGQKIDDELPVPHHSGYVDVEGSEKELVRDHQKITG